MTFELFLLSFQIELQKLWLFMIIRVYNLVLVMMLVIPLENVVLILGVFLWFVKEYGLKGLFHF
jgi:hypothetical protein